MLSPQSVITPNPITPELRGSTFVPPSGIQHNEPSIKMGGGGGGDDHNIIHRMAMEDPIPWWKKPYLRRMYLLLFPCVIGIEMTSGFDSQIINSAQLLPAWKHCKQPPSS